MKADRGVVRGKGKVRKKKQAAHVIADLTMQQ